MSDVVSFRPSRRELANIEKARLRLGAKSRAEVVRILVEKGLRQVGELRNDPVMKYRVPKRFRGGPTLTSREIDDVLYGARK